MRKFICVLLFALPAFVAAQEKDKWERIYTYEDSVVQINSAKVTFVDNDIGRVMFRTILSKPEPLRDKPGVKYKTRLETIEIKCAERRYRIFQVTLLDSKGATVQSYEMDAAAEWQAIKSGGMMEKILIHGCRLMTKEKHKP